MQDFTPNTDVNLVAEINKKIFRVWHTADTLEERQNDFYPTVTPRVVSILREWGSMWDGQPKWKSLLDKHSLLHEAEESIIAIHHLLEGTKEDCSGGGGDGDTSRRGYVALDVCGGKGLFSFLLSYVKPQNLKQIILLEKADIDWYHIEEANRSAKQQGRVKIDIWRKTNLHDYDTILERILELPFPVAMTGIHLCKQLGPSFCSLVNGLGPKCIYACLAPCCLPRAVTSQKWHPTKKYTISINCKETADERQARREYMERRQRLKRKPLSGPCYHCKEDSHNLIDCKVLPTLPKEEQEKIRKSWHAATIPCWNCLEYGHYKESCPRSNISSNRISRQPPTICMDVTRLLQQPKPFMAYCHLLATKGLENRQFQVVETEMENQQNHQEGNWNSERKSIFILATP